MLTKNQFQIFAFFKLHFAIYSNDTPLVNAILKGNSEIVRLLLENNNIDVNKRNVILKIYFKRNFISCSFFYYVILTIIQNRVTKNFTFK